MVILSVVSPKGGVGKTTLTAALADQFSKSRNVFAVDLDPQNALKLHMGLPVQQVAGISRATLLARSWDTCLFKNRGANVLPYGSLNENDRASFERCIAKRPDWLSSGLSGLSADSNDLIIVDTPPGPSVYQQQALHVADFVLVVLNGDPASYVTVPAMEAILKAHCPLIANRSRVAYLFNSISARSKVSRDVIKLARVQLGQRVVPWVVHQDESVKESLVFEQSVLSYAPDSEASRDLAKVSAWLDRQIFSGFPGKPNLDGIVKP